MAFVDKSVHLCTFCGEITSGVFCTAHKTKEGRKKSIEEQLALEKERGSETQLIFGRNRERLFKEYKIQL